LLVARWALQQASGHATAAYAGPGVFGVSHKLITKQIAIARVISVVLRQVKTAGSAGVVCAGFAQHFVWQQGAHLVDYRLILFSSFVKVSRHFMSCDSLMAVLTALSPAGAI
jgi:hypothetical protein